MRVKQIMKKWFSNWISDLRRETEGTYPEYIPHFKNIRGKSLRLKPINEWPKNKTVFDCRSYFIFCPKHQKIAVSDNPDIHREPAVWLPFIYLSRNIKNRLTEEEGLSLILSDGDSQLMAKYREERPFDTHVSEMRLVYLKHTKIVFTDSQCFVRLHSNNLGFQCCQKTSRILWLSFEHFLNDDINSLWSITLKTNEIYSFWDKIIIQSLILEHPFQTWSKYYQFKDEPQNKGQILLKALKITEKQIQLLLVDFIEHCYPTTEMSFTSFKVYLRKFSTGNFFAHEKCLRRLFKCCGNHFNNVYGNCFFFENLLLELALLDSGCPSSELRVTFIFYYYDFDSDEYLNEEEFRELVRDIDTNQSEEEIERVVSDNMFMNESEKGISLQEFQFRIEENWLEGTDGLCRFEFLDIRKILSDLENREKWFQTAFESIFQKFIK